MQWNLDSLEQFGQPLRITPGDPPMTMARAHLVDVSVTRWSSSQGALRDPGL